MLVLEEGRARLRGIVEQHGVDAAECGGVGQPLGMRRSGAKPAKPAARSPAVVNVVIGAPERSRLGGFRMRRRYLDAAELVLEVGEVAQLVGVGE